MKLVQLRWKASLTIARRKKGLLPAVKKELLTAVKGKGTKGLLPPTKGKGTVGTVASIDYGDFQNRFSGKRKGKIKGRYDRLQNTGERASNSTMVYLLAFVAILIVIGISYWIYQGR